MQLSLLNTRIENFFQLKLSIEGYETELMNLDGKSLTRPRVCFLALLLDINTSDFLNRFFALPSCAYCYTYITC